MRVEQALRKRYAPGPFMSSYLALLLIGLALGCGLFLLMLKLQSVPVTSVQFDEKQAVARSDALKVALTAAGGFAVVAGLYVNYRKQRNDEASGIREQDRIFTERFNAAANLLSSEAAAVRLSGINSLVRLADDSARDRDTCLSTICAYLRLPVRLRQGEESVDQEWEDRIADRSQWLDQPEWEVRRTALAALLRRLDRSHDRATYWDTERVDLEGAVLVDLHIEKAEVAAELGFEKSVVVGDHASLSDCQFYSTVSFRGVHCAVGFSVMSCKFHARTYFFTAAFAGSTLFVDLHVQSFVLCGCIRSRPLRNARVDAQRLCVVQSLYLE